MKSPHPSRTFLGALVSATLMMLPASPGFAQDTKYPKAKVSFDDFKSHVAEVEPHRESRLIDLNTFSINLYGYGYRNVYKLNELVKVDDPRITFEGTMAGQISAPPAADAR